jgi:hypothetical protein
MLTPKAIAIFFTLIFLVFVTGCASQAKHFVPENIPALKQGMARVVVTREKQLAGMKTPIYILDIGNQLEGNGEIIVRVGKWIKEPGLSLWYMPSMLGPFRSGGFTLIPGLNFSFEESELTLDEIFDNNLNAVIYVDYLSCDPGMLNTLYCGDGNNECDEFRQELGRNNGSILNTLDSSKKRDDRRNIQVIGKVGSGGSLVWDRQPGLMRLGALWGAFNLSDDIVELTPGNIIVEQGKTYYLHYEISLGDKTWEGDRWTITKVE